jgi:hypothetical protein
MEASYGSIEASYGTIEALLRRHQGAIKAQWILYYDSNKALSRRHSGAIHFLIKRCEGATKALLYIHAIICIYIKALS